MRQADDFEGTWRLERVLDDKIGPMSGTLSGTATWSAADDGIQDYAESGTLTLQTGAQMQAQRGYQWRWAQDLVHVFFADGAPFHDFTPRGQVKGTPHLCGDDWYHVTYDLTDWPVWKAVWAVQGPRKDYVSTSIYSPQR